MSTELTFNLGSGFGHDDEAKAKILISEELPEDLGQGVNVYCFDDNKQFIHLDVVAKGFDGKVWRDRVNNELTTLDYIVIDKVNEVYGDGLPKEVYVRLLSLDKTVGKLNNEQKEQPMSQEVTNNPVQVPTADELNKATEDTTPVVTEDTETLTAEDINESQVEPTEKDEESSQVEENLPTEDSTKDEDEPVFEEYTKDDVRSLLTNTRGLIEAIGDEQSVAEIDKCLAKLDSYGENPTTEQLEEVLTMLNDIAGNDAPPQQQPISITPDNTLKLDKEVWDNELLPLAKALTQASHAYHEKAQEIAQGKDFISFMDGDEEFGVLVTREGTNEYLHLYTTKSPEQQQAETKEEEQGE